MAVLRKIPLNGEHPYWFCWKEGKHYWWPKWGVSDSTVSVSKDGAFSFSYGQGGVIVRPLTQDADDLLPAPPESIDFYKLNQVGYWNYLLEKALKKQAAVIARAQNEVERIQVYEVERYEKEIKTLKGE